MMVLDDDLPLILTEAWARPAPLNIVCQINDQAELARFVSNGWRVT